MYPNKIKSMISWITPKNVTDVINTMGLVGYDRRFIEYFSKLAYPLTSLQDLLLIDNIGLKYLLDKQNLNVNQARWLDFLVSMI